MNQEFHFKRISGLNFVLILIVENLLGVLQDLNTKPEYGTKLRYLNCVDFCVWSFKCMKIAQRSVDIHERCAAFGMCLLSSNCKVHLQFGVSLILTVVDHFTSTAAYCRMVVSY